MVFHMVFHRHLKDHIGIFDPNVYSFSDALLKQQEMTYITLQVRITAMPLVRFIARQVVMQKASMMYLDGEIGTCDYIKRLSFRLIPVVF